MANSQSLPTNTDAEIRDSLVREQALSAGGQRVSGQNNQTIKTPWISDVAFWNNSSPKIVQAGEPNKIPPEAEAEIAGQMSDNKQRQLAQIAQQEAQLKKELDELEGSLTDFKRKSGALGLFRFFQPRITFLIEEIVDQLKKTAKNLADEPKMKALEKLIGTISALIGVLTGAKLLAAVLDILIFLIRVVLFTLPTIFIPIIAVVLSPLYAPFLAIFYFIGKIPFFKGRITQQVNELIEDLKKQKLAWQNQIKVLQKKVDIGKQLSKLAAAKKQIQM